MVVTAPLKVLLSVMDMSAVVKDSGTFFKCPQIYVKLTWFEDNNSGKLPFKYVLLRLCIF